jgi:AcrR family transcriptional regulator
MATKRGGVLARRASAGASPPVRTRLEVDARRAQLVALGLKLFSARAYDAVSIDEVASALGVSKGLLYHYFPTKRDFYVATIREAARQLFDETHTPDEVAPAERLRVGLDAYLDYVERHAPSYAALLRGGIGSDPEVAAIVEDTRQRFQARLLSGLGIASPSPALRVVLRGWVGMVEAASLDWLDHRDPDRTTLRELLSAVLVSAVEVATNQTVATERTGT